MSVISFSPGADRVSEAHALIETLQAWLKTQPEQRVTPMRIELTEYEDGTLIGVTTSPLMQLVKS